MYPERLLVTFQPFANVEFRAEMKQPSRRMPAYIPVPATIFAWMMFFVWAAAIVYLLWQFPWGVAIIAGIVVLSLFETRKREAKLAALIEERDGESICEFARSFDAKVVDTWVIRAVYEELQGETNVDGKDIPIRADDSLKDDLRIDAEDLDMSVVVKIAQRCGRSLEGFDKNPLIGKVQTAHDLVMFFNAQSRDPEAIGE